MTSLHVFEQTWARARFSVLVFLLKMPLLILIKATYHDSVLLCKKTYAQATEVALRTLHTPGHRSYRGGWGVVIIYALLNVSGLRPAKKSFLGDYCRHITGTVLRKSTGHTKHHQNTYWAVNVPETPEAAQVTLPKQTRTAPPYGLSQCVFLSHLFQCSMGFLSWGAI